MRVIAGEFRGRKLLPPEGDVTRPVTDRVKQSLFDILAPDLPGARVYDCFAGTGSMGLECLSRGAAAVVFFEADRSAVDRLKRNISGLSVTDRASIVAGDLFRWFGRAGSTPAASISSPISATTATSSPPPADLVFLDPPYRFLRERPDDVRALAAAIAAHHLAPGGTVVFRHDLNDALDLPPLVVADRRVYGGMVLEFLRAVERTAPPQ